VLRHILCVLGLAAGAESFTLYASPIWDGARYLKKLCKTLNKIPMIA
jgi:hypothetical protein